MENCVVCLVQFCPNEISLVKFTDEDSRKRDKISCVYRKILRIFCKYFNLPCKQNDKENENDGENPEANEILSSFPFCVECRNLVAELCIFHEKSESIHKIIQKTVAKISMKILETQEQNDRENSSNSDPLENGENSQRNKMTHGYRRRILQNFNPRVHLTNCQSQNHSQNQNEEKVPNEINSPTIILDIDSPLNEDNYRDNSKNNDNVAHDDYVDQNDSDSNSREIEKDTDKNSSLNLTSTSLQGNSVSEKTRENLMQQIRAQFNSQSLENSLNYLTLTDSNTNSPSFSNNRKENKKFIENETSVKNLGDGKFLYKNSWPFHIMENEEFFKCDTCQSRFAFGKNPEAKAYSSIVNHIREEHMHLFDSVKLVKYESGGKSGFRVLGKWTFENVELGFKCGHCPKIYTKIKSMINHLGLWHIPGKFKCSKCPGSFRTQGLLNRHRCGVNLELNNRSFEVSPGSGKFVCIGKKQNWNFELLDGKFQCSSCPAVSLKKGYILNHLRLYHDEQTTHMCEECGKIFNLESVLTKHKLIHVKTPAGGTGKRTLRKQSKAEKSSHVCPHCQKTYKSGTGLKIHIFKSHKDIAMTTTITTQEKAQGENGQGNSGSLKFSCGKCPKRFTSAVWLKKHEKFHEVLLNCSKCDKRFKSKAELQIHMDRHNKVFKFFCDICNKGFLQNWQLTRHKETGAHSQTDETVKSKEKSADFKANAKTQRPKRKRKVQDESDSESSEEEEQETKESGSEKQTDEKTSEDSDADATTEED